MAQILICDDDDLVRRSVVRTLARAGHQCKDVASGSAALAELSRMGDALDVLIADYHMPEMDGVSLLMLAAERAPDVPRILISGEGDFPAACDAVNEAGVFRLLEKPFEPATLHAAIERAVQMRQLRREREQFSMKLAANQSRLFAQNRSLERLLQARTTAALEGLLAALDFRDHETQWHSRRVARYARRLGEELGVRGEELVRIEQSALLHDIGKIGIRDSVLLKPGALDADEWNEMRRHPALSYELLKPVDFLREVAEIAYAHHERWDGKGYPRGLGGEAIPLAARLIAIVDTMDAMVSDRPYRKGRHISVVYEEVARCAGTQFAPAAAAAFLRVPPSDWVAIREELDDLARRSGVSELGLAHAC